MDGELGVKIKNTLFQTVYMHDCRSEMATCAIRSYTRTPLAHPQDAPGTKTSVSGIYPPHWIWWPYLVILNHIVS